MVTVIAAVEDCMTVVMTMPVDNQRRNAEGAGPPRDAGLAKDRRKVCRVELLSESSHALLQRRQTHQDQRETRNCGTARRPSAPSHQLE